ncbi:MAG TPA: hypothetical protein VMW80_02925 [Candidatus Dormibacteraeota bacterium]|nr:hypothetical protein [Candidatus Dormibacteraeota bacterium]
MFKAGKARGEHKLVVRLRNPDGTSSPDQVATVNFQGDDTSGANVFIPTLIATSDGGVYWFEISLEGVPMAEVPLTISRAEFPAVTPQP